MLFVFGASFHPVRQSVDRMNYEILAIGFGGSACNSNENTLSYKLHRDNLHKVLQNHLEVSLYSDNKLFLKT